MKALLDYDVEATMKRYKRFTKKLDKLCTKFGTKYKYANDNETNEIYLVINVRDLQKEKDFRITKVGEPC